MEAKWIQLLLVGVLCFSVEAMSAYRQQSRHKYPEDFTPSTSEDFTPSTPEDFTPSTPEDFTPSLPERFSKDKRYLQGDDDVGNANTYVDAVLDNLRKEPQISQYLDPLQVPDMDQGNYKVRNMKIHGLLSLYRHGDCTLTYNGDTVNVVAEVAVKDVLIKLDYSAKAWFIWIHGDGDIGVDHLAVRLDLSSNNGNANLNSFKVVNLGNYSVKRMTGLSFILNWLLRLIANSIAQGSRQRIVDALENEAGKALGNLLKQYKLPIL